MKFKKFPVYYDIFDYTKINKKEIVEKINSIGLVKDLIVRNNCEITNHLLEYRNALMFNDAKTKISILFDNGKELELNDRIYIKRDKYEYTCMGIIIWETYISMEDLNIAICEYKDNMIMEMQNNSNKHYNKIRDIFSYDILNNKK